MWADVNSGQVPSFVSVTLLPCHVHGHKIESSDYLCWGQKIHF